ncbi:MAG: tyrosine-type recombinase/integrase [Lachnospiraceae bacterium]|jgi:integrase|nr:tyrosine-type recombinase/integrase [Lachnospiraceae bacterium]
MQKTQPIKNITDIQRLKQYYLDRQQIRNYTLITLGMNTSLRIGDLLLLKWENVYDFHNKCYFRHLKVLEQKTGKNSLIALNKEALLALNHLKGSLPLLSEGDYIFKSREGNNRPICRIQAFRIIKNAATALHLEGTISCHSLRKTFGYHAWKKGIPPAVIMTIYNHSSLEITKRYLSIDQDDKDQVFLELNL